MKLKITKRDFQFFLLGVLAMVLFIIVYDWQEFKAGFTGSVSTQTEITK